MESQTAPSGLREELRNDAGTISHAAKDRIQGELDARKGGAAEQVKTLSSALESAAGELDQSPDWLRSIFQQGAQTLQRFADTVENKDSRELTRDVEQLARQNPGTFLAGCALAGFAAARVLKAGTGNTTQSGGSVSTDYGTGYGSGSSPYGSASTSSGTTGGASAGSSVYEQAAAPGDQASGTAYPGGIDRQAVSGQSLYGDVA